MSYQVTVHVDGSEFYAGTMRAALDRLQPVGAAALDVDERGRWTRVYLAGQAPSPAASRSWPPVATILDTAAPPDDVEDEP